ncbi:cyclin-dependent kinases regulatory subunit 1 isoform X1 [Onychostruthus taczanowskii]|uniref:cyclin-dependent kinases regulatory subunit 1 isoform X1 n=1 Tax=Onychostruthus taczanowskii TaxID=356909 RepID=UPI001B8032E4|nr:cyclin-dependent kinases regulatory subunit 1 isoform X1 [Onychostruthus taczanowskii]
MAHKQIYYSDKYDDEEFEYRHVMLPKDIAKLVPKTHLLSESEWRNLGVQQSQGWVHYMIHEAPHPALPAAIAEEARKVSGPWSAETLSPSTLRKHLPSPRHFSGASPSDPRRCLGVVLSARPWFRRPFPLRCLQSFNKVMFGSCLSAVPGAAGLEGEGIPVPRSLSRGGSRGGSPGSPGEGASPRPPERARAPARRARPRRRSCTGTPSTRFCDGSVPQVPPLGQWELAGPCD